MPAPAWPAALEGCYGPPLSHEQRLTLIRWLPSGGLADYAYDPFHRDQWRTPYPAGQLVRLAETLAAAQECGIELTLSISPGPDWRGEAEAQSPANVLRVIPAPSSGTEAPDIGTAWPHLPQRDSQAFGIPLASYGGSSRVDDRLLPHPASVVQSNNLTGLVVQNGLEGLPALSQARQ